MSPPQCVNFLKPTHVAPTPVQFHETPDPLRSMNSRASFYSDLGSPISIESYGDLSPIPPSPPSDRDSDCEYGIIRRNISVGPVPTPRGSTEENSLSGRSDRNPHMAIYYENDEEDRFMFGIDGESDASGFQLGCVMSPIRTTHVDPSNKIHSLTEEEDPSMRFNVDRTWKSGQIDPPARTANSAMHQFFVILEMFAVRCAFDHLRRATNNDADAVCSLESSSSSSLRFERKRPMPLPGHRSQHNNAMNPYSGRSRLIHSTCGDRSRNRDLVVHRRVLEKVLRSWRDITVTAIKLRQKYLLMMIVNRWKLFADECIDLRQKMYAALLHWANVRMKRSFAVIKLHSKRSKEEKRQRTRKLVGLSNERDASCIDATLRFDTPSVLKNNFLNEYRGPAVPSVSHPDYRFSLPRNWIGNIRSPLLQSGSISTLTSMRQSYPTVQRDFCAQTTQTLRPSTFASTNCHSVAMPSSFLSNDRHAFVMAGSRQRFTYGIGQPKSENLFLPNSQASVLGPNLQKHAAAPFFFGQVGSSVRSIKDYHQERFLTASVLDEMISMVEHRHLTAAAGAFFHHYNYRV